MTTLQLLIAVAGAVAVAALATRAHGALWRTRRTGAEVTVHTRMPDDQTLRGIVLDETAVLLRLGDVRYLTTDGEHPLHGTVTIPQRNVAWVQENDHPDDGKA